MPTKEKQLTNADRMVLKAVLDRVIPPVDDLPGAGSMGLVEQVESIAGRVPRLHGSLLKVMGALSLDLHSHAKGGFNSLAAEQQDEAVRVVEGALAADFGNFLELTFLAYYGDSRVHQRIGWHGRPPQPEGYEMEPFDEAILVNIRKREPFWRRDK